MSSPSLPRVGVQTWWGAGIVAIEQETIVYTVVGQG